MARKKGITTSLFFTGVSFIALIVIMLLTSPAGNITYAIPFFAVLYMLLVSLGHFLTYLRKGKVGRRSRGMILILSVFILLLVMFKSAGSLNFIDLLIIMLVVGGLLFYSS